MHRLLGRIIDSWSSENKVFVWKVLQKPCLRKQNVGDSTVDFVCFLEALGAGFLIFSALETGLKIEWFSRSPWGSRMAPENKRTGGSMVESPVWVGSNNLSTSSWVITLA